MIKVGPNNSKHLRWVMLEDIGTKNIIPCVGDASDGIRRMKNNIALGVQNKICRFLRSFILQVSIEVLIVTKSRVFDFGLPSVNSLVLHIMFSLA